MNFPLQIDKLFTISNGFFVANISVMKNPLLIDELFTISNEKFVVDYIIFIKFIYLFLSK
jgi:hypothetical protein